MLEQYIIRYIMPIFLGKDTEIKQSIEACFYQDMELAYW